MLDCCRWRHRERGRGSPRRAASSAADCVAARARAVARAAPEPACPARPAGRWTRSKLRASRCIRCGCKAPCGRLQQRHTAQRQRRSLHRRNPALRGTQLPPNPALQAGPPEARASPTHATPLPCRPPAWRAATARAWSCGPLAARRRARRHRAASRASRAAPGLAAVWAARPRAWRASEPRWTPCAAAARSTSLCRTAARYEAVTDALRFVRSL
jgi:hypothetical protein